MKRSIIILFVCMIYAISASSQIITKELLSTRQTGYTIDARLDPAKKTVTGTMQAFWVNKSTDTVPDIELHLYMNAFRNNRTTLNKEAAKSFKT